MCFLFYVDAGGGRGGVGWGGVLAWLSEDNLKKSVLSCHFWVPFTNWSGAAGLRPLQAETFLVPVTTF